MIDYLNDTYCIDDSRIYATGKSNGGGFTGGVLACNPVLSTKIAAFAPVSGAFYVPGSSNDSCDAHEAQSITIPCNPGRVDVPMLEFHGKADDTIAYSGGGRKTECLPTVPHWVREWCKRNGLGLANKTTASHSGKVLKYEYGGAQGKLGLVTHYAIDGLGHDWPSTEPNRDNPDGYTYINATSIIMDFFEGWRL